MAESGGSSEPDAPDEIPKWARYNAKDRGCPLFSSVSFTLDESCCSAFGWMLLWHLATALLRPGSWSGPRTSGRTRAARAALKAIAVYQRDVSPRRPPCCRFTPTCSNYAAEAVRRHGALRGGWQTARRLHRCGPRTTPGSHDPVKP